MEKALKDRIIEMEREIGELKKEIRSKESALEESHSKKREIEKERN